MATFAKVSGQAVSSTSNPIHQASISTPTERSNQKREQDTQHGTDHDHGVGEQQDLLRFHHSYRSSGTPDQVPALEIEN